jgi:hypothetical protein
MLRLTNHQNAFRNLHIGVLFAILKHINDIHKLFFNLVALEKRYNIKND